jgi:hypothetical protein
VATHDVYFRSYRENQDGLEAEVRRLQQDIDRDSRDAINVDLNQLIHFLKRFQRQALFEASMADYQLQLIDRPAIDAALRAAEFWRLR